MPAKQNKLSQFWQELKRRKVVHVITVYASAAFVIIELVNNLAEPLNLPARLPTIAIIVLAVGFPLAIILSWLFDLTSEGVEKTKPLSELREGEKAPVPNAWKIATYVSFVVIIGLAVLNIVGGDKQLRAGDIQSLVILPFDNFTGDDQLEYVDIWNPMLGENGKPMPDLFVKDGLHLSDKGYTMWTAVVAKLLPPPTVAVDESLSGRTLLFHTDFEDQSIDRFEPTDATAWTLSEQGGNHFISLTKKRSKYEPPVRSPYNRALIKDLKVDSFVLDVRLQSTIPDYNHRDLCLFFGYQDPAHFYYVHLGKKADPHANQIFIVNDAERTMITEKKSPGTP